MLSRRCSVCPIRDGKSMTRPDGRRHGMFEPDYRGNRMASASAVALTGTSSGATDGGGAEAARTAIGIAMPRGMGGGPAPSSLTSLNWSNRRSSRAAASSTRPRRPASACLVAA